MKMKKFMNAPETVTDEELVGLGLAYPDILNVDGHLVISKDLANADRVTIVTYGGSGHEPAQAGFVGKGMLDIQAVGDIFAAPNGQLVFDAMKMADKGIAALLPIPFPASVISMVLLFLLLATKLLRPHHIKEKSNFLITNMACFFVPAGVGILRYADVLWANLLPLLAICFITTPLVYGVTAWAVQLTMRAIQKKEARHD